MTNPHRAGWFSERDLVGELADAVRAEGMRFGVYYSGGYDWTFEDHPIGSLSSGVVAWPDGDDLIKPKAFVVMKDQTKVEDAGSRDA